MRYISPDTLKTAARIERTLSDKVRRIEEKGGIESIELGEVKTNPAGHWQSVTITTQYGDGSSETKTLVIVEERYGDWYIQNNLEDLD
jgi:hypothetical protein